MVGGLWSAWLFWFLKRWVVCREKPNVPNALAKNFLSCALGIFYFFSVSGCCLVRCRSVGSGGRSAIATNVPALGEVANFGTDYFLSKIKFLAKCKRVFTAKFAILPNACYAFVVFSTKIVKSLIATFSRL